jgi:hypothetical protein
MSRRGELRDIGRYRDARIRGGTTRRAHRSLDDRARRQVSEYTRLGRRKMSGGQGPAWSSLTGWAWLFIGAGVCVVLVVVTVLVLDRW